MKSVRVVKGGSDYRKSMVRRTNTGDTPSIL